MRTPATRICGAYRALYGYSRARARSIAVANYTIRIQNSIVLEIIVLFVISNPTMWNQKEHDAKQRWILFLENFIHFFLRSLRSSLEKL